MDKKNSQVFTILLHLAVFLCFSTAQAQQPLQAQTPKTTADPYKLSESQFLLKITPWKMIATFRNQSYNIRSMKKLDAFLKEHNIAAAAEDIILAFGKKTGERRSERVLNVLKKNNITNWIIMY